MDLRNCKPGTIVSYQGLEGRLLGIIENYYLNRAVAFVEYDHATMNTPFEVMRGAIHFQHIAKFLEFRKYSKTDACQCYWIEDIKLVKQPTLFDVIYQSKDGKVPHNFADLVDEYVDAKNANISTI